jgi:hypothetical protein
MNNEIETTLATESIKLLGVLLAATIEALVKPRREPPRFRCYCPRRK